MKHIFKIFQYQKMLLDPLKIIMNTKESEDCKKICHNDFLKII